MTAPQVSLRTVAILWDVRRERARQLEKWGAQSHPDGTGSHEQAIAAFLARNQCDRRFDEGIGAWADILEEEFAEAMAEEDPAKLREELIQVAAVAVAWVEDIDQKASA